MCRQLSIFLGLLLANAVSAAVEPDSLFQSKEILEITLTAPFDTIDDDRDKDLQYDGTLSYTDAAGQTVMLDVELSVRGNWRLDRRSCKYSQLWVNLKRGQVPGTLFENQNRLKMVVQCRDPGHYADFLIRELKAYQIFAELSEINFDTRLLNVTYADSVRPDDSRTHLAFFIEHKNRLAERFGYGEVDLNEIPREQLHQQQSTLLALFMYMLGNTDFSMTRGPQGEECCQNAKMLVNDLGEYLLIPYDFDASGFVDATYSPQPDPRFNLRDSRIRLYRGFCVPDEVLNQSIAVFQESREQIMTILADASHVTPRSANRVAGYIEDYFGILDNSRRVTREFVNDCRAMQ